MPHDDLPPGPPHSESFQPHPWLDRDRLRAAARHAARPAVRISRMNRPTRDELIEELNDWLKALALLIATGQNSMFRMAVEDRIEEIEDELGYSRDLV